MKFKDIINPFSELRWRGNAYVLSRVYLAFAFMLGIWIPPIRRAIRSYEEQGDGIAILAAVATIVPGAPISYLILFLDYPRPPWSVGRAFLFLGLLASHFLFTAFWLLLWSDFARKKASESRQS
jgi:hypothetical protein